MKVQWFQEWKERKSVLIHVGYFFLFFAVYGWLRQWYTTEYADYTIRGGDSLHVYAAYIIIAISLFLHWKRIKDIHVWDKKRSRQFRYGIVCLLLFFIPANIISQHPTLLYLIEMCIRFAGGFSLFLWIFGIRFVRLFSREIMTAVLIIALLKLSAMVVDQYWHVFSTITIQQLRYLLPLLGIPHSFDMAQYIVRADTFTVAIGPACAGVGFLTGYTILFLFAVSSLFSHNKKINLKRLILLFFGGFISMFVLNGLRVLLILSVGVWYSEEFALTLFHNGIGAVLFLLFFFVFTEYLFRKTCVTAGSK